jgi:uroporphyrinogen-III synthase
VTAEEGGQRGFVGLRVVAVERRLADQMAQLIERYGGQPRIAPSMREVPLTEHTAVLKFGEKLLADNINIVILLTGVGTRFMLQVLETRWPREQILHALQKTIVVARGPKPIAVLRELGLKPTIAVPEPNTWKDLVHALDEFQKTLAGMMIGVQEYGISNKALLDALQERGGTIVRVPVYRWALPEDTEPLKRAVTAIIRGEADVVLFTNAAQVDHVLRIVEELGFHNEFRQALNEIVVASVGPTAAEHLRELQLPVDFEPSHSKMGILVKETSERAAMLLHQKRAGRTR